jgi:hypothetical protein
MVIRLNSRLNAGWRWDSASQAVALFASPHLASLSSPASLRVRAGERGMLMTELFVAIAIVVATMVPLGLAMTKEHQYLRACYNRAVAMEIVDGEMEILVAGEWRAFADGIHPYAVSARAATNLPSGGFALTVTGKRLRLEWLPAQKDRGGKIAREATVK